MPAESLLSNSDRDATSLFHLLEVRMCRNREADWITTRLFKRDTRLRGVWGPRLPPAPAIRHSRSFKSNGSSNGFYGVFSKWLWPEFGDVWPPDEARGGSIFQRICDRRTTKSRGQTARRQAECILNTRPSVVID